MSARRSIAAGRAAHLAYLLALSAAPGCTCEGWARAPDPGLERMIEQPRVDAYEAADVGAFVTTEDLAPAGTVRYAGRIPGLRASAADVFVPLRTPASRAGSAALARGQALYETFCAPCHGIAGTARTPIAEDMALRAPPSLLSERVIGLPDEEIERAIAEGYGLMPSYAVPIDEEGRHQVMLYVRALQLRDRVPVASLPRALRRELEEALP